MYVIAKNEISKIFEALSKEYSMYGPYIEEHTGQVMFDQIDDLSKIDLNAAIPAIPPKHVIYPHAECILKYFYDAKAKKVTIERKDVVRPKALIGIRSCDLEGIKVLDRFFLGQEFIDEFYLTNRKKVFIVSNTCINPFAQCFCACTDSGPAAKEGYDLNLTELGNEYLIEVGSEKGKALMEKFQFSVASEEYVAKKKAAVDRSLSLFTDFAVENKAWISRVTNRVTTGFIKEEIWEYIGKQCFECGACTFVCPTCSCFNVEDVNMADGSTERIRSWDSCSYEGYSKMAGDHNPRKPIEDRRNKRFFCKLSFSQSRKYLRPGCVGCGRCAWVCPGEIGLPNVVTYI
ncbi:MAG: 4Fe-4S dicluster domain-containing protein, partial [Spirochaetes bacterium]|nr:4Fe-4S dicluster domain-containing protein [Spirochaetota bacterium]